MSILTILIVLVIVGVLLWLVNNYIPMDAKIKKILNFVVVVGVIIWLFSTFGVFHYLQGIHF
jgi:hypothetical protein